MRVIEKTIGGNLYTYNEYKRKKKGGGVRVITAPCEELKAAQKMISDIFYEDTKGQLTDDITGFRPGFSIKDNARLHVNKEWVINLDLKSFFPSTTEELVRWSIKKSNLADFVQIDEEELVELLTLEGSLPQGSPASPIFANFIGAAFVDPLVKQEISSALGTLPYTYTRYADDITFSFNSEEEVSRAELRELVDRVKDQLINNTCYRIAEKKIHVRHRSQRQYVTGIIVNEGFSIPKEKRLNLRAAMHKVKLGERELDSKLLGELNFVREVKPELYNKLVGGLNGSNEHSGLST